MEFEQFGAATHDEVLAIINPLFRHGIKNRSGATAQHARTLKQGDATASPGREFCRGNSCQTASNDRDG